MSQKSPEAGKNKQVYPVQKPICENDDTSSEDEEKRRESVGMAPRLSIVPAKDITGEDRKALLEESSILDGLKELELDGFTSLAEASTCCARVFWLCFLVLVLAVLTQQIYKTVTGYISQPVVSTFTVTYNDSLKFPSLLVCPGNFINETAFKLNPRQARAALAYQVVLFNQSPNITRRRHKRNIASDFSPLSEPTFDFSMSAELGSFENTDLLDWYFNDDWSHAETEIFLRMKRSENNDTNLHNNGSKSAANANGTQPTNDTKASPKVPSRPPTLMELASQMTPSEMYDGVMQIGFDSRQVFLDCRFSSADSAIPEKIPCEKIVKDILDSNYGKCYLVSMGNRTQTVESKGLILTINTMNSQNSKLPQALKRYKGLLLAVEDGSNPASWEKVLVGGGVYMKMELALQHLKLLDVQTGDAVQRCIEHDKANLQVFNVSYTLSTCQIDCLAQEIINKCKCILLTDKINVKSDILEKYGFCQSEVLQGCVLPNVVNNQESSDRVEDCKDTCFIKCDSWRYTMSPSTMALNPAAFRRFEPVPPSDILQLEVAYRSLEYSELIQSYQITVDTFIGNLGGQVTLWIGGSMIALINIPIMISSFLFKKSWRKAISKLGAKQQASQYMVSTFKNIIKAKMQTDT